MQIAQLVQMTIFHRFSLTVSRSAVNCRSNLFRGRSKRFFSSETTGMNLNELMTRLNSFAKPHLAASWDNVGLLVEPSPPHVVSRVLLTNDLTRDVVDEAISLKVDLILSYHPPIFKALKTLTQSSWKERIVVKCVENRIAVYSPHTILDSLKGGVNDWLISPFPGESRPLEVSLGKSVMDHSVSVALLPSVNLTTFLSDLSSVDGASFNSLTKSVVDGRDVTSARVSCKKNALLRVTQSLQKYEIVRDSLEILQLSKVPIEGCGEGRITNLHAPISLRQAIDLVRAHTHLTHLRVARAVDVTLDSQIKSVAVCAGSGGGVLAGVRADLFVTGEMSHHELLDANHAGTSVILCEHSNSERGYLRELALRLNALFDERVEMKISSVDRDPVEIV